MEQKVLRFSIIAMREAQSLQMVGWCPIGVTMTKGETVGDRVRQIRELWDEKQPAFAARLNAAAKSLEIEARYDNTIVSKMETGTRDVGLEDVLVIAAVDRQKRGREWLAWGSESASKPNPELDRGLSEEEEERALEAAARKRGAKRGRNRGGASA